MSDVPIISGIYVDTTGDFRTAYPMNFYPVPKKQGISEGYLRHVEGITPLSSGPGKDRGGIVWNGVCYRVMGSSLISIDADNIIRVLGDVGGENEPVTFAYSFDLLAICSAGNLFYYDTVDIKQVTDPDLGTVFDVVWVDGYFMVTDGSNLIVTDINDPFSVNPFRYGGSEADPDPIIGLLKLRNEVYALNRNTIELFNNVGGDFFPFNRIEGAQIQKGVCGTTAACVLGDVIAFVGNGENEPVSVYVGVNGVPTKISTREIDTLLSKYTDIDLSTIIVESRTHLSHLHLYIHLPDKTIVYDLNASKEIGAPIWSNLSSGIYDLKPYRGFHFCYCNNRWICGDRESSYLGELNTDSSFQFGEACVWEFTLPIVFNEGNGYILKSLELVSISGSTPTYDTPTIFISGSTDGVTWSLDKPTPVRSLGNRILRTKWFQVGYVNFWKIYKIRGDSSSFMSPTKIIIDAEPLNG